MELGKLNAHQAILLTLLVSFVTSVATGIVTVSLMEKAPADITRVINRIIEKPIETITPGGNIVREETVVVREGDLISEAIATAAPSVVRIYRIENRDKRTFIGLGVITDYQGTVMTGGNLLDAKERYTVITSSGTEFIADEISSQSDTQGILKLEAVEGMSLADLPSVSFAPYDTLVLGQTVVAIGGETTLTVSAGIVMELMAEEKLVRAGVSNTTISPGSPLIDIHGRVVGLLTHAGDMIFMPVVQTAVETAVETTE